MFGAGSLLKKKHPEELCLIKDWIEAIRPIESPVDFTAGCKFFPPGDQMALIQLIKTLVLVALGIFQPSQVTCAFN